MFSLSFGYQPNDKTCSCGKHYGIGNISPYERAARAARMRDTMPSLMPQEMREYLFDFEKKHGKVRYAMTEYGVSEGYFNKTSKGQPLRCPVFAGDY